MRIAVIGSGIAGNAAAWALTQPLQKNGGADVTVYEKRNRTGGHSHTVDFNYGTRPLSVDVGFIVYNDLNYPNLVALFNHLAVETFESDMSFGVSMQAGRLEWSGKSLTTLFAQKRNLVSPKFWRMIRDILRFNKIAEADVKHGRLGHRSLRHYLADHRFSEEFINHYLAPMGAAIWSMPHQDILDYPAENFLRFFSNHRLLHKPDERPKWRTLKGGSRSYVTKLTAPFASKIRLDSEVVQVERQGGKIHVRTQKGEEDIFDHVIFASHPDQTLATLCDANENERAILSAIRYRTNSIYLHRDRRLMPKNQKVWSAWNYIETPDFQQQKMGVCVSYHMNALQKIDPAYPLFVSLNPPQPPHDDDVFSLNHFAHPQFDQTAIEAQKRLPDIQGRGNLWYCGAWCGYGFHEDGLKSGLAIAEALGAQIPWRPSRQALASQLEAAE